MALIASNSAWLIVPASRSSLALAISAAEPPAVLAHVVVERRLLRLDLLRAALAHPVVLGDQIDHERLPVTRTERVVKDAVKRVIGFKDF